MKLKKLNLYLIILSLSFIIIIPFLLSNGGLGGDFIFYIKMANKLPVFDDNLFPIGFPFFLKMMETFTSEYFYSSILLKIICYLFIIYFSYKKNFYFRETVMLMCLKSTFWIFIYQSSEYIGLPFLYLFLYYSHLLFNNKIHYKKYIIVCSILGFVLCTIRYANVFIFISSLIFIPLIKKDSHKTKLALFSTIILIGFSLFLYLLYNYLTIGSFASENQRVNEKSGSFWFDTYVDFIGLINLSNPFFYLKTFDYSSKIKLILSFILILLDIVFWYVSFKILRRNNKNIFVKFLVVLAILNGIITFFSAMIQGIEPLGIRILFNSSYLFCFALLITIRNHKIISDKFLYIICFISIMYNACFIVKIPTRFIFYKNSVEQVIKVKNQLPIYYYDDDKKVIETEYHIPFINKSFHYIHENKQPDYIYKSILRLINPSIEFLKEKPKENTQTVILSSEINHFIETKRSAN